MSKRLCALTIALATALAAAPSAQQPDGVTLRVARDGVPAANVPVELQLANQPARQAGVTASAGDLALLESALNMVGKPPRVQVIVYDCHDKQSVLLLEVGQEAPDRNCRKVVAGIVRLDRGRVVSVDLARGTMQSTGRGFLSSRNGRLIAGGGVAVVGIGLLAAGGGDTDGSGQNSTFDPTGNYGVTNTVGSDPGEHRFFILMENNTLLTVTITGTTVRITCPPGSKWTLLTGTFTPATGQIVAEGRGPAAGFANVLFRFSATIAMAGSNRGAMTGSLTIGPNGELNGGPPIVYNVAGTKQ